MGIFPLDQDLLDGVTMEMTFPFVEDSLKLQPNGTFFIQFSKASLNTITMANHYLRAGDMKDGMNLGVAR